jgi:phenylpyruvate tautomerase PptA (4-oxalocrotonate tautomerase family)
MGPFQSQGEEMPMIQADIRRGRSDAQRNALVRALTDIVHDVTGAPVETISAVVRELPGPHTYEAGEPSPEYVAGPGGVDLAGYEDAASRRSAPDEA